MVALGIVDQYAMIADDNFDGFQYENKVAVTKIENLIERNQIR